MKPYRAAVVRLMVRDVCRPFCSNVRINVGQLFRMLAELIDQLRNQLIDRVRVVAAQRILIFGSRLPATDADILLRLQEQFRAGNGIKFRS